MWETGSPVNSTVSLHDVRIDCLLANTGRVIELSLITPEGAETCRPQTTDQLNSFSFSTSLIPEVHQHFAVWRLSHKPACSSQCDLQTKLWPLKPRSCFKWKTVEQHWAMFPSCRVTWSLYVYSGAANAKRILYRNIGPHWHTCKHVTYTGHVRSALMKCRM